MQTHSSPHPSPLRGEYVFSAPPHPKSRPPLAFCLPPALWPGASFWSAPAERSGDGALDFRRGAEAGLRRGASAESKAAWRFASRLPAEASAQAGRTPKCARPSTRAGTILQLVGGCAKHVPGGEGESSSARGTIETSWLSTARHALSTADEPGGCLIRTGGTRVPLRQ
jgi:hypothetical protein